MQRTANQLPPPNADMASKLDRLQEPSPTNHTLAGTQTKGTEMSARFICRQDPLGYWRIQYQDGQLLAQGAWADMLAIIRAIHGRTARTRK